MAKKNKASRDRKGRTAQSSAEPLSFDAHDSNAMNAWGNRAFGDYLDNLSPFARDDIKHYTSDHYYDMNAHLRGLSDSIDVMDHAAIDSVTKSLDSARMPEAVITHRNIQAFGPFKDLSSVQVGSTFTDEGFGSTSLNPGNMASGDIKIKVIVPKGTKAAYIASVSKWSSENELLIQRNTKYEIVSVDPNSKTMTMRIVAQKRAPNPQPKNWKW